MDSANDGVECIYETPDTINEDALFTLAYLPSYPLPYSTNVVVGITNPSTLPKSLGGGSNLTNMKVHQYQVVYVRIIDEVLFKASLRDLMGSRADVMFAREFAGRR